MDTKMANKSRKVSKNILFLIWLNDKKIVISFYSKKQRRGKKIGLDSNF